MVSSNSRRLATASFDPSDGVEGQGTRSVLVLAQLDSYMTDQNRRPIQATIRTPTSDPAEEFGDRFREALSHWASGVAILAVSDGEEIDAITVSSFSALSIDPPLVLVSVGEQTSIVPMLREEGRFSLSILGEEQQAVAGAIAQRLPGSDACFVALDEPVVEAALVTIECSLEADYPGGDHRIFVGAVKAVTLGPVSDPLLYYRRAYRSIR